MHPIEDHFFKAQSTTNVQTSCMSLNEDCSLGATESGSSKSKSAAERTYENKLGKILLIWFQISKFN